MGIGIFGLLLGGAVVKQATDYPPEIRELRRQIPSKERDAVLGQYKKLPQQAKTDFKQALKDADLAAASQILGQDLAKYDIKLKQSAHKANIAEATKSLQVESDFAAKINKILAEPTSIDPALVAEAAKRYAAAVPGGSDMSITEKTKRLLELSS